MSAMLDSAATLGEAEPAGDAHVRLVGLHKRLGALRAVDDVSLDVARGSIVTLLGPSGCGKSTTLRLLAGLYRPDAGEIFLGGERVTHLPPHRRRMTMVFQEYALFPHLSAQDNVGYGLRRRGVGEAATARRAAEMLDLVGLADQAAKHPHQLSGGQQQRVALARALAVDPEVLLLDEPLSNLDAKLRVRLREEIVRLQRVVGKTMVFVTHDQEEALAISDQVAVMSHGKIAQLGTPEEIYLRPASRYVADFVGLANFVDVDVESAERVRLGSLVVPCRVSRATAATAATARRATLMVRPEAVRIATGAPAAGELALPGRVVSRSFLGHLARYRVATASGEWIVDDGEAHAAPHEGDVRLVLDPRRLHVLDDA